MSFNFGNTSHNLHNNESHVIPSNNFWLVWLEQSPRQLTKPRHWFKLLTIRCVLSDKCVKFDRCNCSSYSD